MNIKIRTYSSDFSNKKYKKSKNEVETITLSDIQELLQEDIETIEEKVSRLEKYCGNNLQLWYLRAVLFSKYLGTTETDFLNNTSFVPEAQMKKFLSDHKITPVVIGSNIKSGELPLELVIHELRTAVGDFRDLKRKRIGNQLDRKHILRLREAGVAEAFGCDSEIEELSNETGIPVDRLNKINKDFGSLDNFRKIYIKFMLSWNFWKKGGGTSFKFMAQNKEYIIQIFGSMERFNAFKKHFLFLAKHNKIVTFFDFDEKGFIPTEEKQSLASLIGPEIVLGMFFYSEAMQERFSSFNSEEKRVVMALIDSKNEKTLDDISSDLGVSKSRVVQIKKDVIDKLTAQDKAPIWGPGKSNIRRMRFIHTYFRNKDIFITPDSYILSKELTQKLMDIIGCEYDGLTDKQRTSKELETELTELINSLFLAYDQLGQRDEKGIAGIGRGKIGKDI